VQVAIGLSKVKVIAIAALVGSLLNLPISCYLTARLGVAGVIWGTVLTTLFSNLLVPGIYVFQQLDFQPGAYLERTLAPPMVGAAAIFLVSWCLGAFFPLDAPASTPWTQGMRLIVHLTAGTLAYLLGYILVPGGRGDLLELRGRLRRS
jgi:hypothetical protein